jgi:enoyl-CoA hydratase
MITVHQLEVRAGARLLMEDVTFRVAAGDKVGLVGRNPEPGLGILAAAGAAWRLKELVGEPLAKEVLLAGRVLDAEEALAVRLLNEVVAADELDAAGHRLADRIVGQAPLAVRLTKSVFHAPREAHPIIDDVAQAVLFETQDKLDRMTAFLERRQKSDQEK